MSAWQTWTPGYTRGGIRCREGVSTPCWPVSHNINALDPFTYITIYQHSECTIDLLFIIVQRSIEMNSVYFREVEPLVFKTRSQLWRKTIISNLGMEGKSICTTIFTRMQLSMIDLHSMYSSKGKLFLNATKIS